LVLEGVRGMVGVVSGGCLVVVWWLEGWCCYCCSCCRGL